MGDEQEHGLAARVELAVGGDPHLIVVAQHEAELDLFDLFFGPRSAVDKGRAVKVVAQADFLDAVGRQEAFPHEPALDDRLKANGLAVVLGSVEIGDDDVRAGAEEGRAANAVGRAVVAQDDLDDRDGLVLIDR